VFTGIIQHVGSVVRVASTPAGKRLSLDAGPLAGRLVPGSSLAVDGVCLTVAEVSAGGVELDVVPETLSRTTLGGLRAGAKVNLEPALAAGGPLDGHVVQGHVDGLARVASIQRGAAGEVLSFAAAPELTGQMVEKGSIAVAGVSLTLVTVARGRFSVALVPTTLERTTLGKARISDHVNVELDIIGKYVRRYLDALGDGGELTVEKLRRAGFV